MAIDNKILDKLVTVSKEQDNDELDYYAKGHNSIDLFFKTEDGNGYVKSFKKRFDENN
jgi:hypothetical protein